MNNFYTRLDKVCKEHNTTIYAMEKATKSSKGSFIKWRTSSPSADKLIEIADILGISMDDLIGRTVPAIKNAIPVNRPEHSLALSNYKENCETLANDEHFVNTTQLYAHIEMALRSLLYGELVRWLENHNVNVAEILGL